MDIRWYFAMVRRRVWLLVLLPTLAAGLAFGITARQTRLYQATATVMLKNDRPLADPSYQDVLASQQLAKTYAQVVTLTPVMEAAADTLGLGTGAVSPKCPCLLSNGATALRISAEVPLNTQLILVNAVSASPRIAADGANAVAGAFTDHVRQSLLADTGPSEDELKKQIQGVQSRIGELTQQIVFGGVAGAAQSSLLQSQVNQEQSTLGTLQSQLGQLQVAKSSAANAARVVGPASVPLSPFSPRTGLVVTVTAVLGLIVAAGVSLLLEHLDDRIRTPEDVSRIAAGVTALGTIRQVVNGNREPSGIGDSLLIEPGATRSRALEEYRLLRSNLEFARANRRMKTIAITSPRAGDGKTTTAANLAIVLAQAGRHVVLVDADLRRPSLHSRFGLPNAAGLSTLFLMEKPDVRLLSSQTQYKNLELLSSGPLPPNPGELLSSARMGEVIELLSEQADVVIFDCPPLLAVADGAEISARVDGSILVVDTARTRPMEFTHALDSFERASARVLGVVLNKFQSKGAAADGYYAYDYPYTERPQRVRGSESVAQTGRPPARLPVRDGQMTQALSSVGLLTRNGD